MPTPLQYPIHNNSFFKERIEDSIFHPLSVLTLGSTLDIPNDQLGTATTLHLTTQREKSLSKWQERLLPLMTRMVISLTIFFFVASFVQLTYLHWNIMQAPQMDLQSSLNSLVISPNDKTKDKLEVARLKVLATLEAYALLSRQRGADIAYLSSLWLRYLSFVTGMILALVGASFILGQLQGSDSEWSAKSTLAEFSIKSASPGLILAGLGAILMLTTIIIKHDLTVTDAPVYIRGWDISTLMPKIQYNELPDLPSLSNPDKPTVTSNVATPTVNP